MPRAGLYLTNKTALFVITNVMILIGPAEQTLTLQKSW